MTQSDVGHFFYNFTFWWPWPPIISKLS